MHPSFGIEFVCPSMKWEDVLRGPSQSAVLAHTHKVLNYRTIFAPAEIGGATGPRELDSMGRSPWASDGSGDRRDAA